MRLKVLNIGLPFREHHDRGAVIKEGIMERVTAAKDQIIAERALIEGASIEPKTIDELTDKTRDGDEKSITEATIKESTLGKQALPSGRAVEQRLYLLGTVLGWAPIPAFRIPGATTAHIDTLTVSVSS